MTGGRGQVLPLEPGDGGGRYPGFDVLAQRPHWDDATAALVSERLGSPPELGFFTPDEAATARALTDRILHQEGTPRIEVVNIIDRRLRTGQTDGYRYATMPEDAQAWRESLRALDADALAEHGCSFHEIGGEAMDDLLVRISSRGSADWHGMPAGRVWSLWTRYACAAFYSHPWAWQEIGFAGPAYPRGYKNRRPDAPGGLHGREPFEVPDAHGDLDPVHPAREPREMLHPSGRHSTGHRRAGAARPAS